MKPEALRLVAISIALLLLPARPVLAQQIDPSAQIGPEMDLPDLIRAWRHKPPPPEKEPGQRSIVAAPVIGSNPSSGFVIGGAGQFTLFLGDPATTRITSGIASFTISTKK